MKKGLLLSCLLTSAIAASAQVTPKVQPEAPVAGKTYVLVNKAQTASQYTTRTSWDGALYFLGETDSKYADYALTAVSNEDGSWSFTLPAEDGVTYMVLPGGSANVNVNSTTPVSWKLDAKEGGFYQLILGEGNNPSALAQASFTPTQDLRMHLNANGQYFCVTYAEGPWYPDCYGGITETENEATGDLYFAASDSISFYWGFVSVENIPAYYADMQYSGAINKFFAQYCDIEDYATGFMATYEAAAKIYNEATDDDALFEAGIADMLNAKVALYNEIEAAIVLNEAGDAVLNAAIAAAKDAFNTKTASADVTNATNTLKQAESNYSMGSGDITSLGTNMSFEDLSAQDGNQSSSVAGAPVGWNVYINGNQVVTADEVRNAGIGAWHGVNNDAEGDIMDGSYAFGIWASGVPTYEISQTITDLEIGSYEITAGLMAGSNGNGSRLTTQRIFGNLNSTYYASEEDYDLTELDQTEVFDFAGNEILTTDREMRPVTVKAFVYDGTLTFGVRTDGNVSANYRSESNSAGGDGWFKADNFTIKNLGYSAEDAVEIYNHYADLLDEYDGEFMAANVQEQLESNQQAAITTANTQEEIIAAIVGAKDLMVTVNASVKAYEKLRAAIDQHFDYLDQYENKAGAGEYSDVIYEADEVYNSGSAADEAAVDAIIAGLNEALQACIQSDDITEGMNLTEYIQNPSYEDLSSQNGNSSNGVSDAPAGWDIYVEGTLCKTAAELNAAGVVNWCAINEGDNLSEVYDAEGNPVTNQYTDGTHLWGIWASAVPVIEISQTLKGMPAGRYTVTVDAVVQNDWAGMNLGMQHLFANDYVTLYGSESDYIQNFDEEFYNTFPADVRIAAEIDALNADAEYKHLNYAGNYSHESYGTSGIPYTTSLTFGLAEKGDITLGFRSNRISAVDGLLSEQASLGWFKLDNWTLTYDSFDVPAGAATTGESTAIEGKQASSQATVSFYNLNGTRLAAPQKGINIMKMSNGRVSKVYVK
ncbi:MAG: hypothetical protein J5616_00230 [Bacteroidaceae bacterium]|nr:hypothetical protein [Bacteroidaceae bacterium]